ncbi:MAG: translesion error-prone DNA polymerase V autoproteolytic subunit [Bacteroidetes bacterium]|nr:translesion error-prone DNA polymerase V autoproteolytic subunit [Bacteroidota bacterium]
MQETQWESRPDKKFGKQRGIIGDNDTIRLLSIKDASQPLEIPFINNAVVKAGFPSPADDYLEEEIDLKRLMIKHPASTFTIEVTGDSMKDAFISDPAKLIIDKSLRPQNNDIVLAIVNGEFTVKYYHAEQNTITLYPANEKYKPIPITDGMTFSVFGVVTFVIIETRKIHCVRPRRL